jgi:hypothetical protein
VWFAFVVLLRQSTDQMNQSVLLAMLFSGWFGIVCVAVFWRAKNRGAYPELIYFPKMINFKQKVQFMFHSFNHSKLHDVF